MSVCNVELMSQCSECLFKGWNENYADQLPMEFADGKIRLTHVVAALSVTDQQEADKLLGDPLSCHVCTVPDSQAHYLTPEVTFPVKTAQSVLNKVLDAAKGKFLQHPRQLIGRSPEGHHIWLGTREQYSDARCSAGGVHRVYNPLYEIVHMDINESVLCACNTCNYMQLHAITCNYMQLHQFTCLTLNTLHYMLLQAITLFYKSVLTFLTVGLSQVLSDTLHHIDHRTTCFLFRVAILLCFRFEETIRAEGMTLKLLERRLNNNFEPYKGEDGQIFRGEHSRPLVQAGSVLCSRSRG
jgi:hypothetical protein